MKPSLKWVGHSDSKDITTASTTFAVKNSWSIPKQYSQEGFQELSGVGPEILTAHAPRAGLLNRDLPVRIEKHSVK